MDMLSERVDKGRREPMFFQRTSVFALIENGFSSPVLTNPGTAGDRYLLRSTRSLGWALRPSPPWP
jgi:hypothetical protein